MGPLEEMAQAIFNYLRDIIALAALKQTAEKTD
jgi:hypothetical protein